MFWENPGWEAKDVHLAKINNAPFVREFPALKFKPGLYIIRGPRQIGKSSWLKTILSVWEDPSTAFYMSCEPLEDHKDLTAVFQSIRDTRKLILLDEVSFVREWSRSIKFEMDRGFNGILIVTGSHSVDLRKGADQMPGRLAPGGEMHLLPMDFGEFCEMRERAGWEPLSHLEALGLFFKIGGFPSALHEAGPHGKKPIHSVEISRRWILGDAIKLGRQEVYLRETLSQLALTMTTPISLQTLARRTQMGSHHTALEYISLLEDMFAVRSCYAIDPNTGTYRVRKDKKFYFTDPLLYWMSLQNAGMDPPLEWESQMAEMVAHEALVRRAQSQNERFGYFHSQKGEIDFYSKDKWALEVKWTLKQKNISKAYKDLILPWKRIWTQANYMKDWPPQRLIDR